MNMAGENGSWDFVVKHKASRLIWHYYQLLAKKL